MVAALLPALFACARHVEPSMIPAETVSYTTDDGWTSEIRHYPGDGPPVLLVHGMGANHYNWDFRPEVSLAAWLQERGYDVWVPELRGDPGSVPPSRRARSYTFDDLAVYDVPAVLDTVLARTREDALLWVGHSMGGMLLYTTLEQWPDKVAAGVAIGSPATFPVAEGSHKVLRHMGWAVSGRGRLPSAWAGRVSAAALGRHNPMYGRIAERDNLDWPMANGMARVALVDVPRPMAKQAVGWMRAGTITRLDGTPWVDGGAEVPLLAIGASRDHVVPAANVEASCALFPSCQYVHLGRESGFSRDYGHVDPVVGTTAASEVYPVIGEFLAAQAMRGPVAAP